MKESGWQLQGTQSVNKRQYRFSSRIYIYTYSYSIYIYTYSFSRSKCFHLLIAPIEFWLDNEIYRKIDVTPILFLLVRKDSKHMTEPLLDQALMDSAYRSVYILILCGYLCLSSKIPHKFYLYGLSLVFINADELNMLYLGLGGGVGDGLGEYVSNYFRGFFCRIGRIFMIGWLETKSF